MDKERLVILDGNSLMYRAFFAMPPLTNSEGLHTNALYGFTNMLLKIKDEFKPNYIVTTFDKKAPTFRHKEFADYKAGRKKMPSELSEQFPIVRDILNKFAIDIFEIEGFEADDLIGTLSVFAESKGIEVYIITGDRDALQLATDNVKVVITKKGLTEKEIYDKNRIIEEMGVTPKEFIDVKGLMGDKSDNIPGVPSVGEKTAYKLIQEYKSIEKVLDNIENISGKKIKENLQNYSEQAILSKRLATIITDVPVEIDLDSIKSKDNMDIQGLKELFSRLQFKSLISKIPELAGTPEINEEGIKSVDEKSKEENVDYKVIKNLQDFNEFINTLGEEIYFYYTIENSSVVSKMYIDKIYINTHDENYVIYLKVLLDENKKETIKGLEVIFGEEKKLIGHGVKNLYTVFRKNNIKYKSVDFDTEIAAYLIDPGKKDYSLNSLIESILHKYIDGEEEVTTTIGVSLLKNLYEEFKKEIEKLDMKELFYEVELPLTNVISSMEVQGIKVNEKRLQEIGDKFSSEIEKVEKEIYDLAGEKFNVKSPKQLGKILFEKLDLPVIKKTKTGYSTNVEVLEALADKHPIIEKITYHRQLAKLFSTYVEGLKNVIDVDEKIHSSFNQTVTTTGRLSSTEPNLQNIPIKYEMGREIRKVFVPENEDCVILSADYSQIELRVLAHISKDENLIDAFVNHNDIHTKTASEVFKVPIEEVTHLMRSNAKAVNFGIVYGIGEYSLSKDLNISRKEAKAYIETYLERYPKVKEYLQNIIKEAKETLTVKTILNRRRFIPEIGDSKKMIVAFGERLAMNTPIQGSAADIIKLAMVHVYDEINHRGLKSTLILQVHDELILNVYKNELEEIKEIVKNEMEEVRKLSVPLEVDINLGDTWYDAK